jgi:ABC-type dipeptide/oligopeptide/nickel transport system ATPase subunit
MEGIVLNHVSKAFFDAKGESTKVLRAMSFTLHPGECIALTGESGSGKSTLARLILGLAPITEGEITVDGVSLSRLPRAKWKKLRRVVQGVFQDASGSLNPYHSTYQNMEEALCNLSDLSKELRKKELLALLEKLNISPALLKTPVQKLSGGEQRRISLLRALAVKPKYLVLDEVISGLDVLSCDAVLSTLEEYRRQYGCAYLFITHDRYSAYRIADHIIRMKQGRIDKISQKIQSEV